MVDTTPVSPPARIIEACRGPLPIHFFTIVLNGEPFIRYHLDLFQTLDCDWHWHVVEGVAALAHDTAWSIRSGGHVADGVHHRGRSNDGTSEYLDRLAAQHPERITIYRKPLDQFWDGKLEMVSAPLTALPPDCLLWQIDADELWTKAAIERVRALFLAEPDRTAAFYWCDYFVGERLVISTRYGYAQNPVREWLRTWRYRQGDHWISHEPPALVRRGTDGAERDLGQVRPFLHDEMEAERITFQHFAYVTEPQARFKETYYGYTGALARWQRLQRFNGVSARLGDYLGWVPDDTMVERTESRGVMALASRDAGGGWEFRRGEAAEKMLAAAAPPKVPRIVIDGVAFEATADAGVASWRTLLEAWAADGFGDHIVLLDRAGTAPRLPGLHYRSIPAFREAACAADALLLQRICDEEGAGLFLSTGWTCPISTPSGRVEAGPEVEDMPPEPARREERLAIEHAALCLPVPALITAEAAATLAGDITAAVKRLRHGELPSPSPVWRTLRVLQREFEEAVAALSTRHLALTNGLAEASRHQEAVSEAAAPGSGPDSLLAVFYRGADLQLRHQLMVAREQLAGIENSPFWRLRRIVLAGLRPFGIRRGA